MSTSRDPVIQKRITDYLDGLLYRLGDIELKYQIWLALTEEWQKHPATLNVAPGFFIPVRNALAADVIVSLARLYEDHSRSDRNIQHFLRCVERNLSRLEQKKELLRSSIPDVPPLEIGTVITEGVINDHRAKVLEADKTVKTLLTHRDKFYAHHDKEYFEEPSKLQKEVPLWPKDVETLIKTAEDVLTTYRSAFEGKDLRISPRTPTQTKKVLQILRKETART